MLALRGDGEAVGLVADALQQPERRRRARDHDRLRIAGDEDLFEPFGEADDGELAVDIYGLQRLDGGGELALAAVDHDEVGPRAVLFERAPVAALDYLAHRLVVVGSTALDRADLERSVVALLRFAVLEHHARRHRARPAEVGDVEALDPARRLVESEVAFERFDGARDAVLVGLRLLQLPLADEQLRVGLDHPEEAGLVAALGHADLDLLAASLAHDLFERLRHLRRVAQQHLVGEERGLGVVVVEQPLHQRRVFDALDRAHHLVAAADDLPLAHHEEHADADVGLTVHVDREEVTVGLVLGDDLLLLRVLLERADAVAVLGGLLVLLRRREPLHLVGEEVDQLLRLPVQQLLDLADLRVVVLLRLVADARRGALLDVVVEARLELAGLDVALGEVERARAELEEVLDGLQDELHVLHVGVGAEVLRAVLFDAARGEDAREALVLDADVGVGLVVPEVDVVARLEALDEVVLEDQRLGLGVGDDDLDVLDLGDEDAQPLVGGTRLLEVAPHAAAEVLRLADVEHRALGVFVLVDAGAGGEVGELVGERVVHRPADVGGAGESSKLAGEDDTPTAHA